MNRTNVRKVFGGIAVATALALSPPAHAEDSSGDLNPQLVQLLQRAGFTGRIQSSLETRLGRPVNPRLVRLGRDIFFDSITGLHNDNSCSGCHSPTNGMGDSQPIAVGVDNNGKVGPLREGPHNQRRTPSVANTAFYPALMWNGRFFAPSGNPFDSSQGFTFPPPEGTTQFPPHDPKVTHLLIAQAHIPPTELTEAAGFTGTAGTIGPQFDPFDNGRGAQVPPPDASGFRNEPIRTAVLRRFNNSDAYRGRFAEIFSEVANGNPITFVRIAQAIAEFEFSLTAADAPIDHFARGESNAMTAQQKRGAILFFGKAGCVQCHAVGGRSNEMFSDFKNHVLGVPQPAPVFGAGTGNVLFDGPNANQDFGKEQVSGDKADRYKFRTSPLRNLATQPAFFHNGAFVRLQDAVVQHVKAVQSATNYNPVAAGLEDDLTQVVGPYRPVLDRLDPLIENPRSLNQSEIADLVVFLRDGLLDPRARPEHLCSLVPDSVPSGRPVLDFGPCRGLVLQP
jgi:cytochrome c peroxidase